ncbi:hypothetical protein DFJ73DRAFT_819374 [Zopfochytrium polystomum]|nr:hypothetical protein DFJ73DRAFT_819374 [Zopfochytrium polystomum]
MTDRSDQPNGAEAQSSGAMASQSSTDDQSFGPKELFSQATHLRHWHYASQADVDEQRRVVNEDGINRAIAAMEEEVAAYAENPPPADAPASHAVPTVLSQEQFVTWEEQRLLCKIYETKIGNYCRFFKFDENVLSATVTFFKRFYLMNTVMDHDPKLILLTCLFLGAKVENSYIPLADFLAKVPKAPAADTILNLEFVVSRGIKFHYLIHHVRWPLHGLFLDMQTYLQSVHTGRLELQASLTKLVDTYAKAREYAVTSFYTELTFTHTPSQIAMGCFRLAAQEAGFVDEVDRYISFRINWIPAERLVGVKEKLLQVEEAVKAQHGWQPPLAEGKRIDQKLQGCMNPEYIPDSALHAKRKRMKDEEKERKRAKKAKKEADQLVDVESVFD